MASLARTGSDTERPMVGHASSSTPRATARRLESASAASSATPRAASMRTSRRRSVPRAGHTRAPARRTQPTPGDQAYVGIVVASLAAEGS